ARCERLFIAVEQLASQSAGRLLGGTRIVGRGIEGRRQHNLPVTEGEAHQEEEAEEEAPEALNVIAHALTCDPHQKHGAAVRAICSSPGSSSHRNSPAAA